MPRGKAVSENLRERIINAIHEGQSQAEDTRRFSLPDQTVRDI